MKICVLIKQVPDQGSVLRIQDDETWVDESNLVFVTNESDTYALEEALLLKEKQGGEIVVCSMGPARVAQAIKDALAKGADRALFIEGNDYAFLDVQTVARALADALKEEGFDLILCGLQTDDTGSGQLAPILAEYLDMPHVTLVVSTELENGAIHVKQELEAGWFQDAVVQLPAVLAIQSGINRPRYASLKGIMAMKKKEIRRSSPALTGLSPASSRSRIYLPVHQKETRFMEGTAAEMAKTLVEALANEAKVI